MLDRAYTGLVFGLSARIQVVVAAGDGDAKMEGGDTLVVVKSPQFESAEWRYKVKSEKGDEGWKVEVEQIERYVDFTCHTYSILYFASNAHVLFAYCKLRG